MCGIVGIIGRPEQGKARKLFEQLLAIDVIRGPDSTGVAAVHPKKGITVIKDVLLPHHLMSDKKYVKAVDKMDKENIAYIGHNRLATVGYVNRRNAHPFSHGHITMVHNGTLNNHINIDGTTFGTDSESIAYSISKRGIEETWIDLNGAASLVWWDAREKSYNFITNGRRPLAFAYTEDKRQLIIASEVPMIRWIAARNRVKLKDDNCFVPGTNYHFTVKYDAKEQVVDATAKELKLYRPFHDAATRVNDNTNTTNSSNDLSGNSTGRKDTDMPVLGLPKPDPKKPLNLVNISDGIPEEDNEGARSNGMMGLSEDEFHTMYQSCAFCGSSLAHEYGICTLIDKKNAACETCSDVGNLQNMDLENLLEGVK